MEIFANCRRAGLDELTESRGNFPAGPRLSLKLQEITLRGKTAKLVTERERGGGKCTLFIHLTVFFLYALSLLSAGNSARISREFPSAVAQAARTASLFTRCRPSRAFVNTTIFTTGVVPFSIVLYSAYKVHHEYAERVAFRFARARARTPAHAGNARFSLSIARS